MPDSNTVKELEQIIKNRRKYQVTRFKNRRDLDTGSATLADTLDLLGTLIADLKKQRILK